MYIHCKNKSVYCTLNCPNTHTRNKNSVCIGTNGEYVYMYTYVQRKLSFNSQVKVFLVISMHAYTLQTQWSLQYREKDIKPLNICTISQYSCVNHINSLILVYYFFQNHEIQEEKFYPRKYRTIWYSETFIYNFAFCMPTESLPI